MYDKEKVNSLFPGATAIEAMEVWTLPKHKKHMLKEVCDSGEYFAQLKKDGNWYEYNKGEDGTSYLFSRGVSTKTNLPLNMIENVPHLVEAFAELPNNTVLIGEIYYPNKKCDEVRSIMGCLPKKAIDRQKDRGLIHYYVHDILMLNGTDFREMSAIKRYSVLKGIFTIYSLASEYIELSEKIDNNIFDFVNEALRNGEEGAVLKLKTAPYSEGKRPAWSMIKVKQQDEVDVVCMGFEDATVKYTGTDLETWEYWIDHSREQFVKGKYHNHPDGCYEAVTKPYFYGIKTAIRIGGYTEDGILKQIGTVSSGLTDALREAITNRPEEYIGLVISCQCMEVTEDSLRHPFFLRFRKDKPAESCKLSTIFH